MSPRLTYDPPYEPVKPASDADSETLRKMVEFYRSKGKDVKADYLQAVLDEREGFEERGGPGSGHRGHEGRPGEIGGSQPGEGGGEKDKGAVRRLGITSYNEGKLYDQVEADLQKFSTVMDEIKGVSDLRVDMADGVYSNQSEPTWIIEYTGNGEALELGANIAREADQDSVIAWGADLSDGQETIMSTWDLDLGSIRFTAGVTHQIEGTLKNMGLGATWSGSGTILRLETMPIPQLGGDPESEFVLKINNELEEIGISFTQQSSLTRVLVAKREDDYDWR